MSLKYVLQDFKLVAENRHPTADF